MSFNPKKYKYDIDQVLNHFELERGLHCIALSDWISINIATDFKLPTYLENKRQRLLLEADAWNEEELKMHFLSFVLDFAELEIPKKAKVFYERTLSGIVRDTSLYVICDALLATPLGINTPKTPYFFLQEFKKGKNASNDAEGQMLVAMLIAQAQNADDLPIYGCYLQGRYWYFATLQAQQYCLSRSYDASQTHDFVSILHILKKLKEIILAR